MSYAELRGQATAITRVRRNAVWDTVQYAANGMIFVVLGEQLPVILSKAAHSVSQSGHYETWWLALYVVIITVALGILRFLWVWASLKFTLFRANLKGLARPKPGWRLLTAVTLAGGDLLLRLDDTIARANLQITTGQLDELAIRRSRLTAERDGKGTIELPTTYFGRADQPDLRESIEAEILLFRNRDTARTGQKAQLKERTTQLDHEIQGIAAQSKAKGIEVHLVAKELGGLALLEAKNLVPSLKMTSIRREAARLEGEYAQLTASAAQARGKIAEIELQIIQVDQDLKTEVMKELREIDNKRVELKERRIAAEDQLRRIDIRSPYERVVHQLSIHTVGGVVTASEPVMMIVPRGNQLVIDAKVSPRDIDQVRAGQAVYLRLTALNQRTTPELEATVQRISPDLSKDTAAGSAYYLARISFEGNDLKRLGASVLVPGMVVEVQIRTAERTAFSYLVNTPPPFRRWGIHPPRAGKGRKRVFVGV